MRPISRTSTSAIVMTTILAGILPLAAVRAQPALAFTDVSARTPSATAISALQQKGVIKGYEDGSFRPTQNITRAEILKIALEARDGDATFAAASCFDDVPRSHWGSGYICAAKREGIVSGYGGNIFKPDQNVNFIEMSKMLSLVFRQNITQGGQEWYEPYVLALESAKAIPPSVDSLEKKALRHEVVEIMWRLMEKKTDQPTKGYLNVKYPEAKIDFSSDKVQTAASCADLAALMKESSQGGFGYGGGMGDAAVLRAMPATAASGMQEKAAEAPGLGGAPASADYSQTNVQVQGIDEADIVKTDGKNVYVLRNQTVKVVQARPPSAMKELATIELAKLNFIPQDMYLDGKTLVLLGGSWATHDPVIMESEKIAAPMIYPPAYQKQRAEVRIYDISQPEKPAAVRTLAFDGSILSTRRIANKLYVVTQNHMGYWGRPIPLSARESDILPQFADSKTGQNVPAARCTDVAILPHIPSPSYLTVSVIPLDEPNKEIQREVVVGSAENMYMSAKNLYIAMPQWSYSWDTAVPQNTERTTVYRFSLTNEGVAFQAQGSVPGHILNQFSMDEHKESFRIATTDHDWRKHEGTSTNNLYILNMAMEKRGAVEDIAPGETIYSVRFLGDRAYMVTFQKIDPLFVIDVADPANPKILGKLKIPGYSDYLHPYDDTHIIGFGKEAVEAKEGNFAWYQGMKVALFDVTDVANPKELHKITIGDRGTESPLLHNHKALLFDREKNLLAFPVTVAQIPASQKTGTEPSAYGSPIFQGAHIYELTLTNGFKLRGTISHYDDPEAFLKAGSMWYGGERDIQRVIRIENSLITASNAGVRSHTLSDIKQEGSVMFPEAELPMEYYPVPLPTPAPLPTPLMPMPR